ncbi:unnamed protein product [Cylicostephanus goldi]|uniref:Uncharacterized protein n=1 Tax=Cylicostephanus goldi TaxID=71465 RepID=A0A3P6R8K3_CYLGO|nr:unnamed protein product [Cylicostephanus goldi]
MEKFNVPIDISADAEPKTVETSAETTNENNAVSEEVANHAVDTSAVNPPWQHAQPEAAEEPMPASVPVVSEPSVGPVEERDFLPLRDSGEVMGHPHEDAPPQVL